MAEVPNRQLVAAATQYNELVAARIAATGSYNGQKYAHVTLEHKEVGLVDFLDPNIYDPNLLISTEHTTLYWGSAGHPFDPTSRSQVVINSETADEAQHSRDIDAAKRLIMGATVCRAAIKRMSQESLRFGLIIASLVGHDTIGITEQVYGRAGAPIAMIRAGCILRSNRADDDLVGLPAAVLSYPPLEDPSAILKSVQRLADKFQPVRLRP